MQCPLHSGKDDASKASRRPLNPVMVGLPESQAGKGKNKCAYCAYVLGRDEAINETIKMIEKAVEIGRFPKGCNPVEHRTRMVKALKSSFDSEAYGEFLRDFFSYLECDHFEKTVDAHL